MRHYLWIIAFALLSCNNRNIKAPQFDFYPPTINDTIRKIIMAHINRDAKLFNLPAIYKGVDSFELRIRYWTAFDMGIDLYILKVDSAGWRGYHYNSYTNFHEKFDGTKLIRYDKFHTGDSVFIVKQFVPLCGWANFVDSLYALDIDHLPTQSMIKDFTPILVLDGDGYSIEIARQHSYRFLNYAIPDAYKYKECKTVVQLISLLKRQSGNSYEWPDNAHPEKIQSSK